MIIISLYDSTQKEEVNKKDIVDYYTRRIQDYQEKIKNLKEEIEKDKYLNNCTKQKEFKMEIINRFLSSATKTRQLFIENDVLKLLNLYVVGFSYNIREDTSTFYNAIY
jgi:hypothetical protein